MDGIRSIKKGYVKTAIPPVTKEPVAATYLPYYDTSRIPDNIKVMRPGTETTAETERGDIQVNDGFELGPGGAEPILPTSAPLPVTPTITPTQWVMGAIALYFMFN